MLAICIILACILPFSGGTLPSGCLRLEERPFDHTDPATVFGSTSELNGRARPIRVGSLRQRGALPTGHFITNHIKDHPVPLRLFPYEAIMADNGITYDAYTMERWWDPKRTDEMQQQSAWKAGEPWNKLTDMGTNLKQMVSGPDGNPSGTFTGKSGVRVGIAGSGEPEMTDFGDLFANFIYSGNGGTMEVPLVRGAPLLTHIFKNANPIIKPMCLSSLDGRRVTFNCPMENSVADGGSGHISGTCTGSALQIRLDNTKPITDLTEIQWAAARKSDWQAGIHTMKNCDQNTCRLSADKKRVVITVPNMFGTANFAVNYVRHYLIPPDWINHPEEVNCYNKREKIEKKGVEEISFCAVCNQDRTVEVTIQLGNSFSHLSLNKVQIALEELDHWGNPPAMLTCRSDTCEKHGQTVFARRHVHSDTVKAYIYITSVALTFRLDIDLPRAVPVRSRWIVYLGDAPVKVTQARQGEGWSVAINVIGAIVLPYDHWIESPCQLTCGGPRVCTGQQGRCILSEHQTQQPPSMTTTQPPQTTPARQSTTQSIHQFPPTTENGGQANSQVHISPGKKFIMELDEPGNELPHQTRKFLLYFSQAVESHINNGDDTLVFRPLSGGNYNGIMQLAYLGAGRRGDHSNDTKLDSYLGVYSYKPTTSYCVLESFNTAYANFDWRPNVDHAASTSAELLMITLPHHDILLGKTSPGRLRDTVYTFKGYVGNSWLLEMELPRASMEPDMNAVHNIQQNHQQLQNIQSAIDRDAKNSDLNVCTFGDSYGVGKAVGLFARLGSISRAFGTAHFAAIDNKLMKCLEKWLRIDDSLDDIRKFKYELVWGGLFLRQTHGNLGYGTDYGFPYYNDHHFHLGYFLYAIAYIVKHHPDWGHQHKAKIYALARDVGNPSYNDKYFPVARHKDIYAGFSWATGIVPGERQEESSSEGLNCYHGLAALGEAYNDDHLKHTGQVLLAMEILSVREYWHVRNHNKNHFPPTLRDYGVVGMIGEGDFYAYTLDWGCAPNVFPMRHGCLVGIQIIPITAVSKYWMDKDWASHILKTCSMAIDPTQAHDYHLASPNDLHQLDQGWKAFCYAAMAPYDAEHARRAAEFVKEKTPRQLVSGTGAASTLLFIYGRT